MYLSFLISLERNIFQSLFKVVMKFEIENRTS